MGLRGPKARPLKERLLEKRIIDGECWLWTGAKNNKGYGLIWTGHRAFGYVHRFSYAEFVGPIGKLFVLHSCDKPLCFNPKHLFLGTQKDNLADMTKKGRRRNQFSMAFLKIKE
jgi:hypothetical protein